MKENEESTQPGPVDRCSRVVFSTFLSSNVSRTLSQRIHYLNFFFGKDLPQLSYSFIFWDVPRRSRIFHACSFFYRRQHFLKPIYSFAIMITFVFFLSLFCKVQLIGLVGRLYQTLFKYVNTFSSKETLLNHCLTYKTVEIIFFQTSQPLHSSHLTMQSKHRTRHSERNPKSSLRTRALELFF